MSLVDNPVAGSTVSSDGKTVTVPGEGVYVANSDGTITFTPEANFTGTARGVRYRIMSTNHKYYTSTYTPTVIPETATTTDTTNADVCKDSGLANMKLADKDVWVIENPDGTRPDPISDEIKLVSSAPHKWSSIASSSDGTKLVATATDAASSVAILPDYNFTEGGEYIYTSTDSGVTWTKQTSAGRRYWASIASSADGTKLVAVAGRGSRDSGDYIYTSTDSGVTWTKQTSAGTNYWASVASSADGTKLIATAGGDYIYTSTDSGVTWTKQTSAGMHNWTSVASSADGTKLAAASTSEVSDVSTRDGGYVWTSANSGLTWTEQTNKQNVDPNLIDIDPDTDGIQRSVDKTATEGWNATYDPVTDIYKVTISDQSLYWQAMFGTRYNPKPVFSSPLKHTVGCQNSISTAINLQIKDYTTF